MAALSQTEFQATLSGDMRELASADAPPVPLPAYRASINARDLDGWAFATWPSTMRRPPTGDSHTSLLESDDRNVFLVVVVDRPQSEIVGHHVLNLNDLYGLDD